MKKKAVKKLVLAKETVRSLEELVIVQGGAQATATDCHSACWGFECQQEVTP
jgi:hypothetical protein